MPRATLFFASPLIILFSATLSCSPTQNAVQGPPGPRGEPGPPGPPGNLALAGQRCAEGTFVIGFDESGHLLCSGQSPEALLTGRDCTKPPHLSPRANLQACDLRRQDLREADLRQANLILANLQGVNLARADLRRSNLSGANLSHANLREVNLSGALGLTAQVGPNQTGQAPDFRNSDFSGANLTGAFLVGANLTEAVWNNTICPDGTNSDVPDGDGATCEQNLVAVDLRVSVVPPMGRKGMVSNRFGIPVDAELLCVILDKHGVRQGTTTMQHFSLRSQETRSWSGTCPALPDQTSHISVKVTPRLK